MGHHDQPRPRGHGCLEGCQLPGAQRVAIDIHHGHPMMRIGERLAAAREVLGGGRHA